MASADVRRELDCSVCLSIFTNPVTLKCGHNFCRECINNVLNTQKGRDRGYFCPECREEFQKRPALKRNITLKNIVEAFKITPQPCQNKTVISCTYCVDSSVPAVKFCLNCDASLCDKHLRAHSKAPEHVLTAPTTVHNRKCSTHKKILEYYCTQDSTCICVSCCLIGMHKGHQVESLDEASERKKNELLNVMQKLMMKMEENEKKVLALQEELRKEQEEAAGVTERVTGLFRDLQRHLNALQKKVLSEISRQTEQATLRVSNVIHQLELEKEELTKKIQCMEELQNVTDPYNVLQQSADLCDIKDRDTKDGEIQTQLFFIKGDLDVNKISQVFNTLTKTIREVNTGMGIKRPSHLSLDVSTAGPNLMVSPDMKTVTFQYHNWRKVINQHSQLLSTQSFFCGRHFWEVDIGASAAEWRVGMCYSSRPKEVVLGYDNKSWVLYGSGYTHLGAAIHNSEQIQLATTVTSKKIRIFLDYEAGQISFYDVCDPIRHLHTFTTTFTEPLHAALYVGGGSLTICGDN